MERRSAMYAANSPTTVLPAPVGAATRTPLPSSTALHAAIWKGSKGKSKVSMNSAVIAYFLRALAAANFSAGEATESM